MRSEHPALAGLLETTRAADQQRLGQLVAIPSISGDASATAVLRQCADATGQILTDAGVDDVRLVEVDGAPPYVYGERLDAGPAAPTVLLYAHYDVQPAGDPARWTSPPFTPTERDGRLYGRGAADNKAAVVVHAAALRAWDRLTGAPPVNVRVLVEGEEEVGSPHLHAFLDQSSDLLRADVVVLPDAAMWDTGWPALTWSVRGLADLTVTVRALARPLHSGVWGGAAPDAVSGLARILAALHDEDGDVAVPALRRRDPLPEGAATLIRQLPTHALRDQAGLLPGVRWLGPADGAVLERVWMGSAVTVVGIDVPTVAGAANQLVPEARAKISLRLAPDQDPVDALDAVAAFLTAQAPWGLAVEVQRGSSCPGWMTQPDGPAVEAARTALSDAYGHEPALIGGGGTIPLVRPLSDGLGGVPCLLPGLGDPRMNAHAEDESMHLGDLQTACLAEALLLAELADRADALRAPAPAGG